MDALTLARWQFGITTVYHFFFVPLTLGLVWVVAALHTAWYVTGQEVWKRLTKFWGSSSSSTSRWASPPGSSRSSSSG